MSGDNQHVSDYTVSIDVRRPCSSERSRVDFREPHARQHRITQRQVVCERIILGANPNADVTVASDVAEESLVNEHRLRKLKENVVVTSAHIVNRVRVICSTLAAVGHTKATTVAA